MAKLKNHYAPTPSRIARRHAFHRREQAEGESVNQFMAGLRTAALHCEFKELDEALLDRLVCGLKDLRIQRRLLAKPDLTLQSALDEACTAELSNRSTTEIHGASSPVSEKKTLAVHQEEATEEDADLPGDDDIHWMKTASGSHLHLLKGKHIPEGSGDLEYFTVPIGTANNACGKKRLGLC
ncbi:hypothetical protein E2320_010761 [Naja naja]|nr:hypothetical protein E2320_010761 [Naja naja]